jgi:hypothetical protein
LAQLVDDYDRPCEGMFERREQESDSLNEMELRKAVWARTPGR